MAVGQRHAQALLERRDGEFLGSWACAPHAAPRLPPGGSITVLTGGTAAEPKRGLTAVMATFAAVEALSRSLAPELAPIRVDTIRPGSVDTGPWGPAHGERASPVRTP